MIQYLCTYWPCFVLSTARQARKWLMFYPHHHHISRKMSTARHRPPLSVTTASGTMLLASSGLPRFSRSLVHSHCAFQYAATTLELQDTICRLSIFPTPPQFFCNFVAGFKRITLNFQDFVEPHCLAAFVPVATVDPACTSCSGPWKQSGGWSI